MYSKKVLRPVQKRELAEKLISNYRVFQSRACNVIELRRSVWYYEPHRREDLPLRLRIKEIAATRIRYGAKRIYTLLRREGWKDNHKRVHRVYKEEGLNLRGKRPREANRLLIGWKGRSSLLCMSVARWILWLTSCLTGIRSGL